MKKLMLLASIAMVALLFACGGGGGEETSSAATAAPAVTVDPATAGTVQGTVTLDGEAPEMTVIQMAADPNCARLHTSEVTNEFVITGEGGTLANAFVYLKSGLEVISLRRVSPWCSTKTVVCTVPTSWAFRLARR